MITLGLIILCTTLYFIGGQKWAHTLVRDLGCPLCIAGLAWFIFGFSWWFVLAVPIMWGGMAVGDHEQLYWTPHALVISLGMMPYTIVIEDWLPFLLMIVVVVGGTYLVSRFLNKFGIDVIGRGLLYATIPLWFLIR